MICDAVTCWNFAHATTAVLLWYVQNFNMIGSLLSFLNQNKICEELLQKMSLMFSEMTYPDKCDILL